MPRKRHAKQHEPRRKRTRIAQIPGHTNEFETAEELGVSTRTLRKWRQLGVGPPWADIGHRIYYPDEQRTAWIKSRVVQPARMEAVV
jgi:hypothetical protein